MPGSGARYKAIRELGSGSFGTVFLARDNMLGRDVAVKVMEIPKGITEEDRRKLIERFHREARAVASLSHPNIVIIYDISETKEGHFFSMELLEGEPLSKVISGPMPLDRAIGIARQILEALEYAHAAGVIHRDIKPENIFIMADDQVKLVDFGLARVQSTTTLTRTGAVMGSPGYMPLEMFQGKTIDERADIFSFGVVLYEMLCGTRPFGPDDKEEDSYVRVMFRSLSEEPEPPTRVNPEIPPEMERIILICLQKDPKWRYQSAREVLDEIDAFTDKAPEERDGAEWTAGAFPASGPVKSEPIIGLPPRPVAPYTAAVQQPAAGAAPARKQHRKIDWDWKKAVVAVLAVVLVAAVGVGVFVGVSGGAGSGDIVAKIDSLTVKRLDGKPLDLANVPVGTDLVMQAVVTCTTRNVSGLGMLTMQYISQTHPVPVGRNQQLPPIPGPQIFDHVFRVTDGGQDYTASAEIDLSVEAKQYKDSSDVKFHVGEGAASPQSLAETKALMTRWVADAGAAVGQLRQKGVQLDPMETEFGNVEAQAGSVGTVGQAQTYLDYAISVKNRADRDLGR